VTAIQKYRELKESKDMEMKLKSRYIELSGKENEVDDDLDYDECNLDELNGYDGFAGVADNSVPIGDTTTDDCNLGATNVTAV